VILKNRIPVIKVSNSREEYISVRRWIGESEFNTDYLVQNSKIIAEFLMEMIYNTSKSYPIVEFDKKNLYLDSLVDLFSSKSTFPLFIPKDSAYSQEIFRAFSSFAKHPQKIANTYTSPQYYTNDEATLRITKINSPFFDFYLFIVNIAWLYALYYGVNKLAAIKSKKD